MIKARLVNIGVRIPSDLKEILSNYCDRNGVKLQFFITEAIRERLIELEEDKEDNRIADERLKDPQPSTKEEFLQYIEKRKKQS